MGEEANPHLATASLQVLVESDKVSPEPLLLQTKQFQFPQSLPIRLMLQISHQLHCPFLDMHQGNSLALRRPKLNRVPKV